MDYGISCSPQSLTFLVNIETDPSNGSPKVLSTPTQVTITNVLQYPVAYSLKFSAPLVGQSSPSSRSKYRKYKIDPRDHALGFIPSQERRSIRVVRTGGGSTPNYPTGAEADMELTWCIATEGRHEAEAAEQTMKQADQKGMLKSLRVPIDATLSEKGKPSITSPSADAPYVNTSLWKSGERTSFQLTHPVDGKQYSAYFAVVGLGPSGQGGYAEVWKCQVTADVVKLPWSHVAVKSFRYETLPPPGKTDPNTRALKELAIWRALRHQYVAPLLGNFESSTQCFITIWYKCGNLFDFIRNEDINSDRIRILKEMVEGLEYLHSQNVIHGDIHNGNVLATTDEKGFIHPVYIDFGFSKLLEESYGERIITSSIRQKGRMIYMAPELLLYTYPPRHKASDIYALSLLLLEVGSNRTAYLPEQENMLAQALQHSVANGSMKPNRARFGFINMTFWDLLSSCWVTEAASRPPIEDVKRSLGGMRNRDYYQSAR